LCLSSYIHIGRQAQMGHNTRQTSINARASSLTHLCLSSYMYVGRQLKLGLLFVYYIFECTVNEVGLYL